jgi:O-antigen ligase
VFGSISVTCIVLSRSSTSLLSGMFVTIFMLLMHLPSSMRRFIPYLAGLFAVMIVTYALAVLRLIPGLDILFKPVAAITGKDMTFSSRSTIWEIIKENISLHPKLGGGYGAYWIGQDPSSPSFVFLPRMYFYPSESHNGYLEIVNDLGYVGLICLLGFLVYFLRQSLQLLKFDRSEGMLYLALFFAQAIANLSESTWFQVNAAFVFAIMTLATATLGRSLQHHLTEAVPGNTWRLARSGSVTGSLRR